MSEQTPPAEDLTPITLREAWERIMDQRPQYKKNLDTPENTAALWEHTNQFVSKKLLEEGETRLISAPKIDSEINTNLATKPFSEWEKLCFEAGLERGEAMK